MYPMVSYYHNFCMALDLPIRNVHFYRVATSEPQSPLHCLMDTFFYNDKTSGMILSYTDPDVGISMIDPRYNRPNMFVDTCLEKGPSSFANWLERCWLISDRNSKYIKVSSHV
jgi:hypothetical protein